MADPPLEPLSPSAAEAIARRAVPTATVTEVVARTGGQLSRVYEVRCAEPEDTVIVKVYADEWRWKQAKEVHVYQLLTRHGVGGAPMVLHAEPAGELPIPVQPVRVILDPAFTESLTGSAKGTMEAVTVACERVCT